jgi:hypothetical protein
VTAPATGRSKPADTHRWRVRRRPPPQEVENIKKSNISEKCCNISQNVEKIFDKTNIS